MGTAASTAAARRQWQAVDEAKSSRNAESEQENGNNIGGVAKLMEAKSRFLKTRHGREGNTASTQKQLDSTDLIKELYKRMDATVTQPDSGDIKGDVQLALKYNHREHMLLVKVIRARDLVAKDLNGKSDPYVKLDLVPDRHQEGGKKTQYQSKTLNPVFREIFTFKLEQSDITKTKLRAAIWDHDFFGEDDFNGEAIIDLSEVDFSSGTHTDWYMLQLQTDFSITGELELSLEYVEPETLVATIHQARDIRAANSLTSTSDAYVKCAVTGMAGHEQTKVVRGTLNPEFEETFEFIVPREEFEARSVLFHLFDKELMGSDRPLGQVHVDLKNFDLNEPVRDWYRLADLKNVSHRRAQWAQNAVAQEFREAMYAHAMYKFPTFMHNVNSKGKKLYSVSSRNAGSSAKVFLVNGIPVS